MFLCKHMRISHICQIQRDQTPVPNSYRVMNSRRDNSVHTAESPDPVIQIKSIYAYIMNIYVPRMVVT